MVSLQSLGEGDEKVKNPPHQRRYSNIDTRSSRIMIPKIPIELFNHMWKKNSTILAIMKPQSPDYSLIRFNPVITTYSKLYTPVSLLSVSVSELQSLVLLWRSRLQLLRRGIHVHGRRVCLQM